MTRFGEFRAANSGDFRRSFAGDEEDEPIGHVGGLVSEPSVEASDENGVHGRRNVPVPVLAFDGGEDPRVHRVQLALERTDTLNRLEVEMQ